MFIAPYGCSWANPSPCKSLLAQCFKYRAWFKHTFLFGSLAFSYSLERVDFSFVHTILSWCCSLQYFFHPEAGKPVSSFWIRYTSPQASGKEAVLLNLSVHQPNPFLVLQSTSNHLHAFGDTMTLLSGRVRKNLCQLRFDKYLTLAPHLQLDNLCNGALCKFALFTYSSQLPIKFHSQWIGCPHYDGIPLEVLNSLQYQYFPKVKGALMRA